MKITSSTVSLYLRKTSPTVPSMLLIIIVMRKNIEDNYYWILNSIKARRAKLILRWSDLARRKKRKMKMRLSFKSSR
jgi:hypothetical protein